MAEPSKIKSGYSDFFRLSTVKIFNFNGGEFFGPPSVDRFFPIPLRKSDSWDKMAPWGTDGAR
jgi:hypothetical protein